MRREPIKLREPIIFDKSDSCPFECPCGYVYLITNQINGHKYVGKHRFNKPTIDTSYNGSGYALHQAYKLYGKTNFSKKIIEWIGTNNDDLNSAEIKWIEIFDTFEFPQHYNLTSGGDGVTHTEEWKAKMSIFMKHNNPMKEKTPWNKGIPMPEEQKIMLRNNPNVGFKSGELHPLYGKTGLNNPNTGKKRTKETRMKMSHSIRASFKVKPHPRGYKLSEEHHKRVSEARIGMKFTDSHRENLRLSHIGKSSGSDNPMSKKVVQLDPVDGSIVRLYSYMNESCEFGFNPDSIRKCCKDLNRTYKGFKWMYKEDYEKLNK